MNLYDISATSPLNWRVYHSTTWASELLACEGSAHLTIARRKPPQNQGDLLNGNWSSFLCRLRRFRNLLGLGSLHRI